MKIGWQQLKVKITDAIGTNLFFRLNGETQEADFAVSCDKVATLEHVFCLLRNEFTKPFVPTDTLNPPK